MKDFLVVFIGGGLGSITRFAIGRGVALLYTSSFPIATFITNIIACFILGFCMGYADNKHIFTDTSRLFWTVGFCGGFSTFSTFSNETLGLLQSQQSLLSLVYVGLSVTLCLASVWSGQWVGRL